MVENIYNFKAFAAFLSKSNNFTAAIAFAAEWPP